MLKPARRLTAAAVLFAAGMVASPWMTPSAEAGPFTYQGQLKVDGANLNGTADIQFRLFNAASGGAQVGTNLTINNVNITDGLVTQDLDFNTNIDSAPRWIEIAVRSPAGSGVFTTLTGRQKIRETPLAGFALKPWQTTATSTWLDSALYGNVGIGVSAPHPNFRLQVTGGTGVWKGGLAATGTNTAVVAGELAGIATIGGHSAALNAWSDLAINPAAGKVGIGTNIPQTALHVAGQDSEFLSLRDGVHIGRDGVNRARIELVTNNVLGPYIDFINDNVGDYDARLELATDNIMQLAGASLRIPEGTGASLSADSGYLLLGDTLSANLGIDTNKLQARNAGNPALFTINGSGGDVTVAPLGITRVSTLRFPDGTQMTSAPRTVDVSTAAFSVGAGGGANFTITVPGAAVGMGVSVSPPFDLAADDVIAFARVVSSNTVRFKVKNTGSASSYPAGTWQVTLVP
jgi:hypothetical protein